MVIIGLQSFGFLNDLKIQELKNVSIHPEYPHLGVMFGLFLEKRINRF